MFFVPQYHTGASAVDILDNRSNFRVLFTKRLDEIVLRREYRGCCHQNDQNLAGCEAAANQYMTQQTVSGVLIKNTDLERTKHTPDRHDDLVCTNSRLNEYFGFTQNDVNQILKESNTAEYSDEIKAWYDGYHFGTEGT